MISEASMAAAVTAYSDRSGFSLYSLESIGMMEALNNLFIDELTPENPVIKHPLKTSAEVNWEFASTFLVIIESGLQQQGFEVILEMEKDEEQSDDYFLCARLKNYFPA